METIQRWLLYPFSFIYALIMFLRNLFFDIKIIQSKKLSVPVISVGNITAGGTGKTPVVAFIAKMLQNDGYKVGIISRGYRRSSKGYVVVSDGSEVFVNAGRGGDEPVMLAHKVSGAVVAVHEKRYRGGKFLIEDYGVNVIIMDDGFQHRALHRDLDIVLINASKTDHLRAHIPAGRLRERLQSLQRADIVIVTKYQDDGMVKSIEKLVHRYTNAPVIGSEIIPEDIFDVRQGKIIAIKDIATKKAFLFSGIAHPREFYKTVDDLGVTISGYHWFPDHHSFSERDIHYVLQEAKQHNADIILTTEKDAVRLRQYKQLFTEAVPLYAVAIAFSVSSYDKNVLENCVHRTMNKNKRSITIN